MVGGGQLEAFRDVGREAVEAGVDPSRAVLAQTTSQGVLATAQGARWDDLDPSGLIVVMDVDPVKGVMLIAGPGEVSCWTGVLYLVMRHRQEVTAALFEAQEGSGSPKAGPVRDMDGSGPLEATQSRGWGFQEEGASHGTKPTGSMVEWAARALEGLKGDRVVGWEDGSVMATASRLEELVPLYRQAAKTSDGA